MAKVSTTELGLIGQCGTGGRVVEADMQKRANCANSLVLILILEPMHANFRHFYASFWTFFHLPTKFTIQLNILVERQEWFDDTI